LSLSEYGIKILKSGIKLGGKKRKKGELVACPTEEIFYRNLKMACPPPELREDQGEIEAALLNKLPCLIELKDIKGEFHVHSKWSDGAESIEDLAEAAFSRGYQYLGICDHAKALGIARGLTEKDLKKQWKEIEKINEKYKGKNFRILKGLEVDILADGSLDIKNEILKELDIVTASIHSSFRQPKRQITKRLLSAIKNPHVDIIGHPMGRIIGVRDECEIDWEEVFKAARDYGVALEINAQPARLDLKDILVREAAYKYKIKIVINTDSHFITQLDFMRYGVDVARRGWLEPSHVLNTLELKELERWLK